jgi:hypothetical protein
MQFRSRKRWVQIFEKDNIRVFQLEINGRLRKEKIIEEQGENGSKYVLKHVGDKGMEFDNVNDLEKKLSKLRLPSLT